MYYIENGKVYVKEGDAYRNVGVSVKNRVIVTKELESVSVTAGTELVESLKRPQVATLDEVIAKMGITEETPLIAEEYKPIPKETKKK